MYSIHDYQRLNDYTWDQLTEPKRTGARPHKEISCPSNGSADTLPPEVSPWQLRGMGGRLESVQLCCGLDGSCIPDEPGPGSGYIPGHSKIASCEVRSTEDVCKRIKDDGLHNVLLATNIFSTFHGIYTNAGYKALDRRSWVCAKLPSLAAAAAWKGSDHRVHAAVMKDRGRQVNPEEMFWDFYCSIYTWQNVRNVRLETIAFAGSALCATILADQLGESDGTLGALEEHYRRAMVDGFKDSVPLPVAKVLDEVIITSACMALKTRITNGKISAHMASFRRTSTITQAEFLYLRWWDAAMAPFYKLPLVVEVGNYAVCAERGPLGAWKCGLTHLASDNLVRYNEVIDFVPDAMHGEVLNELWVAKAMGWKGQMSDYVTFCTAVPAALLACDCKCKTHSWGLETAAGCAAWYALVPRYSGMALGATARQEEARLRREEPPSEAAYNSHATLDPSGILPPNGAWCAFSADFQQLQTVPRGPDPMEGCTRCLWLSQDLYSRISTDNDTIDAWLQRASVNMDLHGATSLEVCIDQLDKRIFGPLAEQFGREEWRLACHKIMMRIARVLQSHASNIPDLRRESVELFCDLDAFLVATHQDASLKDGGCWRRVLVGSAAWVIETSWFGPYKSIARAIDLAASVATA